MKWTWEKIDLCQGVRIVPYFRIGDEHGTRYTADNRSDAVYLTTVLNSLSEGQALDAWKAAIADSDDE